MVQRNAAQLRADAIATGLFNGPRRDYVGDGYTVPWQTFAPTDPAIGFTLYTYKLYLDNRWLEFSRLHDWLYTPYGRLIAVTQEEADDALQEELNTVSPHDAIIVGNACRYFGFLFFGYSQTGYYGETGEVLSNNMGLADPSPLIKGVSTMPMKVVILFQQSTTPTSSAPSVNFNPSTRLGGWSESFYTEYEVATAISLLKGPRLGGVTPLLQARAAFLSNTGNILGVRLYAGGAGKGKFIAIPYKGSGGPPDQPGIALWCSAASTFSGQSRGWSLRGIPDGYIEDGEWKPTSATAGILNRYLQALNGFGWMEQVDTNLVNVLTIDVTGLVRANAVVGFNIGQQVTIKNTTITATGNRYGGKFFVEAGGALNTEFKLKNWTAGPSTGGTASIVGHGFTGFNSAEKSVVRATQRKVGRPFDAYRGRKSRKRKTV